MESNDEKLDNYINTEYYTVKMVKYEEMIEGRNIITYQYPDKRYYII